MVIDATARGGLPGVDVRLDDTVRVVTDADGTFEIRGVTPATHQIAFSRVGYEPKSYPLPISDSDQDLFVSVALERLPPNLFSVRLRVEGAVTDAISGRGVRGVRVQLDTANRAVTDTRGMFEIRELIPGPRRLRFTRIGYLPKSLELPLDWTNRHLFVTVALEPLPVELEPVVVRGDTSSTMVRGRLAEFFRRQRQYAAWGRFLTPQDIERRNLFRVSSLFYGVAGARVDDKGTVTFREGAAGTREPLGRRCSPAVYLHGMFLSGGIRLDELARPEDLAALEVYRSSLTTPLELARSGTCGTIVLWTR
ncbi:MAG: carboxypeptidase regulatory-like domain-containing protein [Gemmatimonadetes bacterium]|nr:carboxypeptidase regulatory-like domain-containing protein [Gemmatimonadota bacterium]